MKIVCVCVCVCWQNYVPLPYILSNLHLVISVPVSVSFDLFEGMQIVLPLYERIYEAVRKNGFRRITVSVSFCNLDRLEVRKHLVTSTLCFLVICIVLRYLLICF